MVSTPVHDQRRRRDQRIAVGLCVDCGKNPSRTSRQQCEACRKIHALSDAKHRRQLKEDVIAAYGGLCVCCREERIEFLTIDHANGDGKPHRLSLGGDGHFYDRLRQLGYPNDPPLRVMCQNCNWASGHYGVCPHTQEVLDG